MSEVTTVESSEKKRKRDKQDKKLKKTKKVKQELATESPTEIVEPVAATQTPTNEEHDEDLSIEKSPKKRKRDTLPEGELEIDINLPEPPSKKALRKLKKDKGLPAPATTPKEDSSDDHEEAKEKPEAKPAKRSDYGIWIGNLPWTATKDTLRTFLKENGELTDEQITRIHMPAPKDSNDPRQKVKPKNKGFAYIDFSTSSALEAALALTETLMGGRKVLIKNSKSFEGRPREHDAVEATKSVPGGKPPNNRIFVGNLAYDVTKDDLREHFEKCGEVQDVFMATFEDSGKCKGFAWVTFKELDAAVDAVKGYTFLKEEDSDSEDDSGIKAGEDTQKKPKKEKKQKWWVNRLNNRPLRCEFAEDAASRYKKRYGKGGTANGSMSANDGIVDNAFTADADTEESHAINGHRKGKKSAGGHARKVDPRNIKPGQAHANAQRSTAAIVEPQGKKIIFD